jgi:adenylate cyclase
VASVIGPIIWRDTREVKAHEKESHGSPGTIQVTESVFQRLRDRFDFGAPEQVQVKGRGVMATYQLIGRKR